MGDRIGKKPPVASEPTTELRPASAPPKPPPPPAVGSRPLTEKVRTKPKQQDSIAKDSMQAPRKPLLAQLSSLRMLEAARAEATESASDSEFDEFSDSTEAQPSWMIRSQTQAAQQSAAQEAEAQAAQARAAWLKAPAQADGGAVAPAAVKGEQKGPQTLTEALAAAQKMQAKAVSDDWDDDDGQAEASQPQKLAKNRVQDFGAIFKARVERSPEGASSGESSPQRADSPPVDLPMSDAAREAESPLRLSVEQSRSATPESISPGTESPERASSPAPEQAPVVSLSQREGFKQQLDQATLDLHNLLAGIDKLPLDKALPAVRAAMAHLNGILGSIDAAGAYRSAANPYRAFAQGDTLESKYNAALKALDAAKVQHHDLERSQLTLDLDDLLKLDPKSLAQNDGSPASLQNALTGLSAYTSDLVQTLNDIKQGGHLRSAANLASWQSDSLERKYNAGTKLVEDAQKRYQAAERSLLKLQLADSLATDVAGLARSDSTSKGLGQAQARLENFADNLEHQLNTATNNKHLRSGTNPYAWGTDTLESKHADATRLLAETKQQIRDVRRRYFKQKINELQSGETAASLASKPDRMKELADALREIDQSGEYRSILNPYAWSSTTLESQAKLAQSLLSAAQQQAKK